MDEGGAPQGAPMNQRPPGSAETQHGQRCSDLSATAARHRLYTRPRQCMWDWAAKTTATCLRKAVLTGLTVPPINLS